MAVDGDLFRLCALNQLYFIFIIIIDIRIINHSYDINFIITIILFKYYHSNITLLRETPVDH